MSKTPDGDSAFPVFMQNSENDAYHISPGMSLRDYFAGQALAAMLPVADDTAKRRGEDGVQAKAHDYASIAYLIADAMIAERSK